MPVDIHVIDGELTFCKINLERKKPPLVFQVKYQSYEKGSLRVFGSYLKHIPNANECEFTQMTPSTIEVPALRGNFTSNWYYLSFSSPSGVKITVTPQFISDKPKTTNRISFKERYVLTEYDELPEKPKVVEVYEQFKRRQKLMQQKKLERDSAIKVSV